MLPLLQPSLTSAATETVIVMHQLVTVGLALWFCGTWLKEEHVSTQQLQGFVLAT